MKSMARKRSFEQSTSARVMENPTQPAAIMENPTQSSKKPTQLSKKAHSLLRFQRLKNLLQLHLKSLISVVEFL